MSNNPIFLQGDQSNGYSQWTPEFTIGDLSRETRSKSLNLDPSNKFNTNYFKKTFPTTKFFSGLLRSGPEQFAGESWFVNGSSYKIIDAYPFTINALPKIVDSTNPTGISFEISNVNPPTIGDSNLSQSNFGSVVSGFSKLPGLKQGNCYEYFFAVKGLNNKADNSQVKVEGVDDLSVTLTVGNDSQYMRVPIMRGSPYLTFFVNDQNTDLLFFQVLSGTNRPLKIEKISGAIYAVKDETNQKEFRLYLGQIPASDLQFDPVNNHLEIPGTVEWVRIICVSSNTPPGDKYGMRNFGAFDKTAADKYYKNIPLKGKVKPHLNKSANKVELTSTFELHPAKTDDTLYYCIPPHYDLKDDSNVLFQSSNDFSYYHLKGFCRVVKVNDVTKGFTTTCDAVQVSLDIPDVSGIDSAQKKEIIEALHADYKAFSDNLNACNKAYQQPYNMYTQGALLFGYAYLIVVAKQLNEDDIAKKIYSDIIIFFKTMFLGKNIPGTSFPCKYVAYDDTWGGILYPKNCTAPDADPPNDIGNQYGFNWYADHHFHLGYYVFISAILNNYFQEDIKNDPDWQHVSFKDYSYALVGDYGCPTPNNDLFPYSRMKDFFWGHSQSLGIKFDGGADGENQESSSEAINAYYAMANLGKALGDEGLADWGAILASLEVKGNQIYYQSYNNDYLPKDSLLPQWGIICNNWTNKFDSSTYWGQQPIFGSSIEFIPLTPVTKQVFPAQFADYAYQTLTNLINCKNAKPIDFPNREKFTAYPFPKLSSNIFNGFLNDQSECSVGGAPGASWLPVLLSFLALTSEENAQYAYDTIKTLKFDCTEKITVQDQAKKYLPVTAKYIGTTKAEGACRIYQINSQTKTWYMYYFAALSKKI